MIWFSLISSILYKLLKIIVSNHMLVGLTVFNKNYPIFIINPEKSPLKLSCLWMIYISYFMLLALCTFLSILLAILPFSFCIRLLLIWLFSMPYRLWAISYYSDFWVLEFIILVFVLFSHYYRLFILYCQ